MIEEKLANRDFRPDYAALELNHRDNWDTVRSNYRRLVHLWHPDRYAQRPRERLHAQQRFIDLNMAYTHLKRFRHRHGHLPFEAGTITPKRQLMQHEKTLDKQTPASKERRIPAQNRRVDKAPTQSRPDVPARAPRFVADEKKGRGGLIWLMAGGLIIMLTIIVVTVLDRRANQAILERGREVIRQVPESDFLPSTSELRRSEAKDAIMQQPTR